jgi:beta-mannosidase
MTESQQRRFFMEVARLDGTQWRMRRAGETEWLPAAVPGSVYADLIDSGRMDDPYWRDNEMASLALMDYDYEYQTTFTLDAECLQKRQLLLCFDGLDTLCAVSLNGERVAFCDNMHRQWKFNIKGAARAGENTLDLVFRSPTKYIKEESAKLFIDGSTDAMEGFPHLRKAHCMFGWDWGPRLPDAGVWRGAYVAAFECARIENVLVRQMHDGNGRVELLAMPELAFSSSLDAARYEAERLVAARAEVARAGAARAGAARAGAARAGAARAEVARTDASQRGGGALNPKDFDEAKLETAQSLAALRSLGYAFTARVAAPDGKTYDVDAKTGVAAIDDPQIWWPRGYGSQPLYTVDCALTRECNCAEFYEMKLESMELDRWTRRVGLRTLSISRRKDEWGEEFCHIANGVRVFAMGADYIPEDNILRRVTPERTRRLLEDAALAGMNSVRVWGGGLYPSDDFYDICDELGLIVWQDFMFACSMYELTDAFQENIRRELIDNIKRLRHHASLGLFCGNNEMEWQVNDRVYRSTPKQHSDYVRMYEHLFPALVAEHSPETFYWPASPSSGGGFDEPNDPNRGDVHYWEVWHGGKPFSDYRNYFFRYASEFGFQSFPSIKAIESFTEPGDRNIFSYVMEKHQRSGSANAKILGYLGATFLYPTSFGCLVYASQLLQAEAIRYGIEHWRAHRGRCMGAIYWQLNDCWPVASWSSIDYLGRWKALHYFAKRFFAKVLLSCAEEGVMTQNTNTNAEPFALEKSARLSVANESTQPFSGVGKWSLRDAGANVIRSGDAGVECPALASVWLEKLDFQDAPLYESYLSFSLYSGDDSGDARISGGSALFCLPKHFKFRDPKLAARVEGDEVVVSAEAYARSVEIDSESVGFLLEDNYFDMDAGERRVKILRGEPARLTLRSVYDIR